MTSTQELVEKYQNLSDSELLQIYEQIDDYSAEAKEALNVVLAKSGGINGLNKRLEKESERNEELNRLKNTIIYFYGQGNTEDEICNAIRYNFKNCIRKAANHYTYYN